MAKPALPLAAAAGIILLAATADGPLAAVHFVKRPLHRLIDWIVGGGVIVASGIFYRQAGSAPALLTGLIGVAVLGLSWRTNYAPKPIRMPKASRRRAAATVSTPSTTPTPVAPTPVAPTPVAPTPVAPTPVAPTPVAPTPVAPTPVAPTPVAPTPVSSLAPPAQTSAAPPVSGASQAAARDQSWTAEAEARDVDSPLDEPTPAAAESGPPSKGSAPLTRGAKAENVGRKAGKYAAVGVKVWRNRKQR
jgi:hypothetical protein